jgi:hypothetical protein
MDTTPNYQADLDKKIAVGLCRLLDSLNIIEFHGDLAGLEVDFISTGSNRGRPLMSPHAKSACLTI